MPQKAPRIVTVCVRGKDPKSHEGEADRFTLMEEVAHALAARPDWGPLDAVVFPGGFLFAETAKAKKILADAGKDEKISRAARAFLSATESAFPGLQLIVGVDTAPYKTHGRIVGGQQLALAFNQTGLSGFARKIFPIDEDVDGKTMPPFITHAPDFEDSRRIIALANGSNALLCVCYDMFGIGVAARGLPDKLRKVVQFEDKDGKLIQGKQAWPQLTEAFDAYRQLQRDGDIDVALATIHRFEAPGRDTFWQRHGIATASAALEGGLTAAAAHINRLSPDPQLSRLAAVNVPYVQLESGMHRQAYRAVPLDHAVASDNQGRARWMARLYTKTP